MNQAKLAWQLHLQKVQLSQFRFLIILWWTNVDLFQTVGLLLSSVVQISIAQLVGDIDKDALKAAVEQQLEDQEEKDSKCCAISWVTGSKDFAVAENDIVLDVGVLCNSEDITLTLTVTTDTFNGMIYPKGLSKNSTCMTEYIQQEVSVTWEPIWTMTYSCSIQGLVRYTLPLRSCNTMSTDVSEGVEYFNTVVVQPHRKLVTNQGRGYHVRCRYQTQEKLLQNDFNVR